MLKKLFLLLLAFLSVVAVVYVIAPDREFPAPPPGSVQSMEDADTETPMRRAYFTDYTREEVIAHYKDQFAMKILGINIPSLRLNYPPEEAQTLIRDQTRSTFLEELVYPLRESFYINGFKPKEAKDEIWYKGVHYEQKIIVRSVPSNVSTRLLIVAGIIIAIAFVVRFLVQTLLDTAQVIRRKRA